MPDTIVDTPFGPIVVEHPEGASDEDILRFARFEANAREERRRAVVASDPAEFDPSNEEFRRRFGAADPSRAENFRTGFGKGVTDLGRGIRQLGVEGADLIPGVDLTDRAREFRENQRLVRERDADLLNTGSGLAGTIAGVAAPTVASFGLGGAAATSAGLPRVGSALTSVAAPSSFPTAALSGGVQGALAPVTENESRFANTAVGTAGGLIGQGLGAGFQRLAQPVSRGLSQTQDDAVALLTREGVDLDVAQRTGSAGAQRLRSALTDNPLTTGGSQRFRDAQARQFTRAVLRTVDIDADQLTPRALGQAFGEASEVIDDAARANPAVFDAQLAGDIRAFSQRIPLEAGDDAIVRALQRNIDNVVAGVDRAGRISGDRFLKTRSSLSNLSQKTPLARDLQSILIDALERGGGNSARLSNAIAKWRNLRLIENSLERGTDKLVSPLRLSNTLAQKTNRALSLRGLGHPSSVRLSQLADAGRELLPETIGQSGTTPRALIGEALLFAGGAGGAAASGQDLGDALAIGAGAAALPLALQRGFQSQGGAGRFLAEGLQNPILRNLLQSRALNIASGQAGIQGALAGAR